MLRSLAINVDSTTSRLAVDGIIVALVTMQAWLGWRFGLVRRAFILIATFAAAVGATGAGNAFGGLIRPHDPDANALCFVAIFVGIGLLFEVIGALTSRHLRGLVVVLFDRCSGAAAGAIIGILQAGVITLAVLSAGDTHTTVPVTRAPFSWTAADAIRSATLGGAVVALEPGVTTLLSPALPRNFEAHLTDSGN